MYYKMTYNLYNDGWLLETIEDDNVDSWHFEPLCGVPDAEIAGYMPEEAEILENTVDLDTATQTVTYTYEEPHLYCDVTYKKQLVFDFGDVYYSFGMCEPGTWGFRDEVDAGSYEDWHLNGTWYGKFDGFPYNDGEEYYLTIEEVPTVSVHANNEGGEFEISGSCEMITYYNDSYTSRKTFDGPFTVRFDEELGYIMSIGSLSSISVLAVLFDYDEQVHFPRLRHNGEKLSLLTE